MSENTYKVLETVVQPTWVEIEISSATIDGDRAIAIIQDGEDTILVDPDSLVDLRDAIQRVVDFYRPAQPATQIPGQGRLF